MSKKENEFVELDHGGGGFKSAEIIGDIRSIMNFTGKWKNCEDDSAVFFLGKKGHLVFTTDAFIVDPLFFPGGDIGKISMCGTINDLAVMGADPLGISLSIVMEEGFPREDLRKIIKSIDKISKESGVPVVTGDTKVTEKGKIDKIEITTAGVGIAQKVIKNSGMKAGDLIISSGDLGEHAVTLLATRFNYKTKLKSDCGPMNHELKKVREFLTSCKDPTRGGVGANLVEMAEKSKVKVILQEKELPYKKETKAVSEILGIDIFSLASEGRFIASVRPKDAERVLKILQKFNPEAKVIGKASKGKGVFLENELGGFRPIEMPKGKLIPRIC
ncbi:MAG: hydrogenase expression/formation protein HypE [Candidatus Moranbacteria bacterium]|nr:hydrogenase expression/formation protein HypE [Candidatus Moranbacteria bacterium]